MTATFELDAFERIVATPGTVLLRVAGRWRAEADEQLPEPVLRAGHQLLTPLPGPTPPRAGRDAPHWVAAYAAPVELLHGAFALEVGPQLVPLPEPAERASEPGAPVDVSALQARAAEVAAMARDALAEVGPLRDRVAQLEAALGDRAEEIDDLRRRCHEAERAQAEETAARRGAEEEVDSLARRLEEAELARDHLRASARDAEAVARDATAERDELREAAPSSSDSAAGRAALALLLVLMVAGGAFAVLELTHVIHLTSAF